MDVLKKGLLASAILALSTGAYALESMDDQALSDATGQQGLTITTVLSMPSTATLVYTDADGVAGNATYNKSGDLVVSGFGMAGTIKTVIDVGGDGGLTAGSNALLNIGISGSTALTTNFSTISVVSTSVDGANNPNLATNSLGNPAAVITTTGSQTLTLAAGYNINIQLGSGATNFMTLTGSLGTITLGTVNVTSGAYTGNANLVGINDTLDGGTIGITGVQLKNVGLGTAANPTSVYICSGVSANCTGAGIQVALSSDTGTTGTGFANMGLAVANITAGASSVTSTAAALGSLYIGGLNLKGTTVLIAGH